MSYTYTADNLTSDQDVYSRNIRVVAGKIDITSYSQTYSEITEITRWFKDAPQVKCETLSENLYRVKWDETDKCFKAYYMAGSPSAHKHYGSWSPYYYYDSYNEGYPEYETRSWIVDSYYGGYTNMRVVHNSAPSNIGVPIYVKTNDGHRCWLEANLPGETDVAWKYTGSGWHTALVIKHSTSADEGVPLYVKYYSEADLDYFRDYIDKQQPQFYAATPHGYKMILPAKSQPYKSMCFEVGYAESPSEVSTLAQLYVNENESDSAYKVLANLNNFGEVTAGAVILLLTEDQDKILIEPDVGVYLAIEYTSSGADSFILQNTYRYCPKWWMGRVDQWIYADGPFDSLFSYPYETRTPYELGQEVTEGTDVGEIFFIATGRRR